MRPGRAIALVRRCGCDAHFAGLAACHCSLGCHASFADRRAYDAHRASGRCAHPVVCGMELTEHRGWALPAA